MIASVGIVEDRLGQGGESDQTHVGIKVEGTPQGGSFAVRGSRLPDTPEVDRLTLTKTNSGGGWWEVTLTTPGIWYLWLQDGAGWSQPYTVLRLLDETRLLGLKLRDILRLHKGALDRALKPHYNALSPSKELSQPAKAPTIIKPEIAQIVYGLVELTEEYPAIVVHDADFQNPYVATGFCREITISYTITCMLMHRERLSSMKPAMDDLGQVVQSVLNLPEYNRLTLSTGVAFVMADAPRMTPNEDAVPGMGWGAEATIRWSAKRLHQQTVLIPT